MHPACPGCRQEGVERRRSSVVIPWPFNCHLCLPGGECRKAEKFRWSLCCHSLYSQMNPFPWFISVDRLFRHRAKTSFRLKFLLMQDNIRQYDGKYMPRTRLERLSGCQNIRVWVANFPREVCKQRITTF